MVKIEITQPVGVPAEQAAHKGHVVAAFHNGHHVPYAGLDTAAIVIHAGLRKWAQSGDGVDKPVVLPPFGVDLQAE